MWIRTQNKEVLMQVDILEISETYKKHYNIESHCYVLGTYSTKEKALKVLNELEEFVVYENAYQMPEDDEVEDDEN